MCCFVVVCGVEERELGRQQAPGACPYCGGKVEAVDVETQRTLLCLPLCYKVKRRYFCSLCSKRLVMYL
uniref:Methionyl-tRNA synthetase n=1 Tax=Kalanchoe fedtschenkoi TaxID=63787 RepID=A0A7N0THT7_KALFE